MPATATAPAKKAAKAAPPKREPVTPSWVGRVPQLKPGTYADGMPIHSPEYICCKLILRPNKFHSRESFFDFGKVFKEPAKEHGVKFSVAGFDAQPVKIREVLFIDTEDFRLYNNAFILRRRIPYKDGFPIGDPEIVFKFRHTDLQMAAETDVRPQILGDHRVKFKVQAMPLKERLGGVRMLFSHNVQFLRSAIGMGKEVVTDMDQIIDLLPVLARVRKEPKEKIKLVSNTIIEEVLQDIGLLDFGDGLACKANVAYPRRAPPSYRRVRLPVQVSGPQFAQQRRPASRGGVLHLAAVLGRGLHCVELHENGHGVPAPGKCSQIARMRK